MVKLLGKIKFLYPLVFFFCVSSGIAAQSLFWSISGNNLKENSYLFGTMHTADSRAFNFQPGMLDSLRNCEKFIMEIDPDSVSGEGIFSGLFMKGDTTLRDLLNIADYALIESFFRDSMNLEIAQIHRMKPLFIASMIEVKGLESEEDLPVDLYLHKVAQDSGLKIKGLETANYQISLFDSLPYYEQAQEVVNSVEAALMGSRSMDTLLQAYIDADLEKMMQMTKDEAVSDRFIKLFIDDRNQSMASSIARSVKAEKCFVAVGAAHLPGENGIISLLRKEGFLVEPILK